MSKPQKDECEVIRSPVKLKKVFRNHVFFTFHLSKHTFTHFRKIEKNHDWNIKMTLFPNGQSVIFNNKQKQNQTWLKKPFLWRWQPAIQWLPKSFFHNNFSLLRSKTLPFHKYLNASYHRLFFYLWFEIHCPGAHPILRHHYISFR